MLKYINDFNSAIVVLHEIYGINEHISDLCLNLSTLDFDIYCPNLLKGLNSFDYSEEEAAYTNFYQNVGLDSAFRQVKDLLEKCRSKYKRVYVVGYSVGATIAWLCSNEFNLCDKVVGFYGSRIRDYLEVEPKCPIILFYPTEETSFSVESMAEKLVEKKEVRVKIFPGKHGFADPFSKHYVEKSHKESVSMMIEVFKDNASRVSPKA